MPGVLRVACLHRLLGADVHGDGDDGQDADVPGAGQTLMSPTSSVLRGIKRFMAEMYF